MALSVCDCIILALLRYLVSNCYVLLLPKQCNALGAFIVQPMHWNSGSLTHKVFSVAVARDLPSLLQYSLLRIHAVSRMLTPALQKGGSGL